VPNVAPRDTGNIGHTRQIKTRKKPRQHRKLIGAITNGQPRDTGNIGHARQIKTRKKPTQHRKLIGAIRNGQPRDTGNIGHARQIKTRKKPAQHRELIKRNIVWWGQGIIISLQSDIGGGNLRKAPTCLKSLTNFITYCCIEYTST
jgi:hypothetical protein